MNISQWKNGDRTFFSLEVDDRLLLTRVQFLMNPTVCIRNGVFVKLREREGQGVDLGRSLKGHL